MPACMYVALEDVAEYTSKPADEADGYHIADAADSTYCGDDCVEEYALGYSTNQSDYTLHLSVIVAWGQLGHPGSLAHDSVECLHRTESDAELALAHGWIDILSHIVHCPDGADEEAETCHSLQETSLISRCSLVYQPTAAFHRIRSPFSVKPILLKKPGSVKDPVHKSGSAYLVQ
jgi:hypothetical protein